MGGLLDAAEAALAGCIDRLALPALLLRKERAVGIVPKPAGTRIPRESLEEMVLVVQRAIELSPAGRAGRVPFCAFNGGRDVWVDVGDKSWGVRACQAWFGGGNGDSDGGAAPIRPESTLHVGDQFLSLGANDFRARSVCTTAWVASEDETVELLDELAERMGMETT